MSNWFGGWAPAGIVLKIFEILKNMTKWNITRTQRFQHELMNALSRYHLWQFCISKDSLVLTLNQCGFGWCSSFDFLSDVYSSSEPTDRPVCYFKTREACKTGFCFTWSHDIVAPNWAAVLGIATGLLYITPILWPCNGGIPGVFFTRIIHAETHPLTLTRWDSLRFEALEMLSQKRQTIQLLGWWKGVENQQCLLGGWSSK